jgi:hypothetical protein
VKNIASAIYLMAINLTFLNASSFAASSQSLILIAQNFKEQPLTAEEDKEKTFEQAQNQETVAPEVSASEEQRRGKELDESVASIIQSSIPRMAACTTQGEAAVKLPSSVIAELQISRHGNVQVIELASGDQPLPKSIEECLVEQMIHLSFPALSNDSKKIRVRIKL